MKYLFVERSSSVFSDFCAMDSYTYYFFRPAQSTVSSRLCFGQIIISPVLCKPSPKRTARFKIEFDSLSVGMLRRPRFELTLRLIRWEVMSSSHLTNGKIVELEQTDHKQNLPSQTLCLSTNQGTANSIIALHWNISFYSSRRHLGIVTAQTSCRG